MTLNTHPITLNVLAHVHNEAYLSGTFQLEGLPFPVMIGLMHEYVQTLDIKTLPSTLMPLFTELGKLNSKMIELLGLSNKAAIVEFSNGIAKEILALQPEQFLLLPSGWCNPTGGHSMICEFKRVHKGFLCIFYNAGAGLGHHAIKASRETKLHQSALTYHIPEEGLSVEDVSFFIKKIVMPMLPGIHKKHFNEQIFYKTSIQTICHLNASLLLDDPAITQYTTGQLSGVCTKSALYITLKKQFGSLDSFRRFIYGFNHAILTTYWDTVVEPKNQVQLTDPAIRRQLELAIRHQLRLLGLKHTETSNDLFDDGEKSVDVIQFKKYLEVIKHYAKTIPIRTPCQGQHAVPEEASFPIPSDFFKKTERGIFPCLQTNKPRALLDVTQGTVIEQLIQINERVQASQDLQIKYEQLEHTIVHLNDASKRLIKEQQDVFYQLVSQLEVQYLSVCSKLFDKNLPARATITILCLLAAVHEVHLRLNDEIPGVANLHHHMHNEIASITGDYPNIATFATYHPMFDAKLADLRTRYRSQDTRYDDLTFYNCILLQHTELHSLLKERYQECYPANVTTLNRMLNTRDLTALYYFLEHFHSLKKDASFTAITTLFERIWRLERIFYRGQFACSDLDSSRFNSSVSQRKLQLTEYEDLAIFPLYIKATRQDLNQSIHSVIRESKYKGWGSKHTPCLYAHWVDSRLHVRPIESDNFIQLGAAQYLHNTDKTHKLSDAAQQALVESPLTISHLSEREYYHLRHVPFHQPSLTVDYFTQHLDQLRAAEVQLYLELNVFQPGLLLHLLQDPDKKSIILNQLDFLCTQGFLYFHAQDADAQNSIFFIRLNYLYNQYVFELHPEQQKPQFISFLHRLDALLETYRCNAIASALHRYRFLTAMALLSQEPLNKIYLRQALLSWFYFACNGNVQESTSIETHFQIILMCQRMRNLLSNDPSCVNEELCIEIAQSIAIELDNPSVEINYPIATIQSQETVYTLDFNTALVRKNNLARASLPIPYVMHPLLKQFDLDNETSCWINQENNLVCLSNEQHQIRFLTDGSKELYAQAMLQVHGTQSWYQLLTHCESQAKRLHVTHMRDTSWFTAIQSFSSLLTERDMQMWKQEEGSHILFCQRAQPCYRLTTTPEQRLTRLGDDFILCKQNSSLHQRVAAFEADTFVCVWKKEEQYEISLPRYNLVFTANDAQSSIQFQFENNTFELYEEALPIGYGVAQLTFRKNEQTIVIIPIQPFMVQEKQSSESEYWSLYQDINAKLPKHIIRLRHFNNDLLWQYTNTEKYVLFNLHKGEPVPTSCSQALFLCYLYLGSHQPKKAWHMLNRCDQAFGGLDGTYEEMGYLEWIIQQLPANYHGRKQNCSISTPPHVACQLKALALLADFKRREGTISDYPSAIIDTDPNASYQAHIRSKIKWFEDNWIDILAKHYALFQRMKKDLPIFFMLSDTERALILTTQKQTISNTALEAGSLNYEQITLKLKELKQAHATLNTRHESLNPYERAFLKEIETRIEQNEPILGTASTVANVAITLAIRYLAHAKNLLANKAHQLNTPILSGETPPFQLEGALDKLKPGLTGKEFFAHFPCYFYVAIHKTNEKDVAKLNAFCIGSLLALRHNSLLSQKFLLANLLYRLIHNNTAHLTALTYADLIETILALPNCPDILAPQLVHEAGPILGRVKDIWDTLAYPSIKALSIPESVPFCAFPEVFYNEALRDAQRKWQQLANRFDEEKNDSILDELKQLAENTFINEADPNNLYLKADACIVNLNALQATTLNDILRQANNGPQGEAEHLTWERERLAKQRVKPNKRRLITLYFQKDETRYRQLTGLSSQEIQRLHTTIGIYVAQELVLQQLKRVKERCESLKTVRPSLKKQFLFELAKTLFALNLVNSKTETPLAVFQYYEKILLRPSQKKALMILQKPNEGSKFDEVVLKLTTGAGKSKVILPLLAKEKADGSNLIILVVPEPLLHTHFADLKKTSALFEQSSCIFEFSRYSNCSAKRLESLYEHLQQIIINRDYLVTTAVSMQSFQLKYLELLLNKPETDAQKAEWTQQVYWADKLVNLFLHQGDMIIDEIQEALAAKNKLNYTLGHSNNLPQYVINKCTDLYAFFPQLNLGEALGDREFSSRTLADVISNPQLLSTQQLDIVIEKLAKALIQHPSSPLGESVADIVRNSAEESIYDKLENYLLNRGDGLEQCIPMHTSKATKEIWAVYKEQLNGLLSFTLQRKLFVNYGSSKDTKKPLFARQVAVPYATNDQPKERSRFGNNLETINYTVQELYHLGLNHELLQETRTSMMTEARLEMHEKGIDLVETSVVKTFLENTQLNLLELPNNLDAGTFRQLSKAPWLISEVLKKRILPTIRYESTILYSDAACLVDTVRSCQGITATPDNHTTYHQRLYFETNTTEASLKNLIETLTRKETNIRGLDYHNIEAFIERLFDNRTPKPPMRAIIDIGPIFQGVPNHAVAEKIADYILEHSECFTYPTAIEYVLFFNEKNRLSAIPVHRTKNIRTPILLSSSNPEEINRHLNCSESARFTYYDQSHAIGADLKQDPEALAFLLTDPQSFASITQQGIGRMRDFAEGEQTVEIIVPKKLEGHSISELIDLFADTEKQRLKKEHFTAALDKMQHVVRNDLMQRIVALDSRHVEQKKAITHALAHHFIETNETDFFKLYGGMVSKERGISILSKKEQFLIANWETSLKETSLTCTTAERATLINELRGIINATLKAALYELTQSVRKETLGQAVEVEQEVEVELEIQKEINQEIYTPLIKQMLYYQPKESDWLEPHNASPLAFKSLHALCSSITRDCIPDFSDAILASKNFYQSYEGQIDYLDKYAKPVHALLFHITHETQLKCIILTQQECADVTLCQRLFTNDGFWMSNTSHTLLAGTPPRDIQHDPAYQTIIEQIRYFNGEINALLHQTVTRRWLAPNHIHFFKQTLSNVREYNESELATLDKSFSIISKAISALASEPYEAYAEYDWKANYPDISAEERTFLQNLAAELVDAYQNIDQADSAEWQPKKEIPIESMAFVKEFIDTLKALRNFIHNLSNPSELTDEHMKALLKNAPALINWAQCGESSRTPLLNLLRYITQQGSRIARTMSGAIALALLKRIDFDYNQDEWRFLADQAGTEKLHAILTERLEQRPTDEVVIQALKDFKIPLSIDTVFSWKPERLGMLTHQFYQELVILSNDTQNNDHVLQLVEKIQENQQLQAELVGNLLIRESLSSEQLSSIVPFINQPYQLQRLFTHANFQNRVHIKILLVNYQNEAQPAFKALNDSVYLNEQRITDFLALLSDEQRKSLINDALENPLLFCSLSRQYPTVIDAIFQINMEQRQTVILEKLNRLSFHISIQQVNDYLNHHDVESLMTQFSDDLHCMAKEAPFPDLFPLLNAMHTHSNETVKRFFPSFMKDVFERPELTEDELKSLIPFIKNTAIMPLFLRDDRCKTVETLRMVLEHMPSLEPEDKSRFIEKITHNDVINDLKKFIEENNKTAVSNKDEILDAIKAFELSAYRFLLRNKKNPSPKLEKAAHTSLTLYNKLISTWNAYASSGSHLSDEIKQQFETAINEATPVLKEHRGFNKQVANLVLCALSLGILLAVSIYHYKTQGEFYSFFKTSTDSYQALNDLKNKISQKK